MRKIIVSEFITLDGVMESPHEWSFPYWGDEIAEYKNDELFASDAQLLGRVTYEGFAKAWPERKDEAGFADRINATPKYVVSTTLEKADWNNSTIIKDNIFEEIAKLKKMPGEDILVHGSATLVNSLLEHNLVDVIKLLVYPLVLGKGKRLFKDGERVELKLLKTKLFNTGVVALHYEPVKNK